MSNQDIVMIPIAEIRIINPRSRNRVTFQAIKASIGTVGLKKPVTVHRRPPADDGTQYDLVCGQGRLESVRELGDSMIPAIVKDVPEEERYLMSLVENLARRPPANAELLREVKRLTSQRYKATRIAEKLGLDRAYIAGVITLLRRGEEDLIRRVEAGRLPIDAAVKIAAGGDVEIQRALSEAYENGTLRGEKLRAVQRLLAQRKTATATNGTKRHLTSADLVRAYEHHTQQQRALVRRSAIITQRLAVLASSIRRLFADDHFVTLLRAEGLLTMPDVLAKCVTAGALPCQ